MFSVGFQKFQRKMAFTIHITVHQRHSKATLHGPIPRTIRDQVAAPLAEAFGIVPSDCTIAAERLHVTLARVQQSNPIMQAMRNAAWKGMKQQEETSELERSSFSLQIQVHTVNLPSLALLSMDFGSRRWAQC